MRYVLMALPLTLALTACLDRGEYPSLRPRAYESADRGPVPPPPDAPPAKPEIVARAAALLSDARDGQRAFVAELGRVRPVVARAGAAASETWISAQEAVSGLDASRVATVTALAELDALTTSGVDASGLRYGDNDFATLRAAAGTVQELARAQGREIAALAGSLAEP